MDNSKIKPDMHAFMRELVKESLRDWFKKEKWVRITTTGNIAGPCGTSKNTKNPDRCLPKAKAQSLTKAQRAATARKKKKAGAKGKTVVKNTKAATVRKESKENWPKTLSSSYADEYEYRLKEVLSDGRAKYDIIDLEKLTTYGTIIFDTVDDLKIHADDLIKPQGGTQSTHLGETKEAPDGTYFTKSGNLVKGRMTKAAKERGARKSDPKDKMRSKVPPVTQYTETADPQDGKAAPYGSGYGPVTKEDIRNLVVGMMQENEIMTEKDDRCTRIAKRKYDTWPSAYASGAVVRCRRGEIWKGVKEEEISESNCKHGRYYCNHDKKYKCRKGPKKSR